jgi:hypothetical protein
VIVSLKLAKFSWTCMPSKTETSPYRRLRRAPSRTPRAALGLALVLGLLSGCEQTLDVGHNQGKLPGIDRHNPAILINDSVADNWSPEYAALFANNGGPKLLGIVVNANPYWPDLDANVAAWKEFVTAAQTSGMRGIPEVTRSQGAALVVPPDRQIESTEREHSAGAQLIVNKSRESSLPVVLFSGSNLTDIADAYLIDDSVVDRVVVIALLGSYSAPKGSMTGPNGDLDPWADWIVAQKFRYIQVSVYYDQSADVTANELPSLPDNAFGTWMKAKHPKLFTSWNAADQETILALATTDFVTTVEPCSADISGGFGSPFGQGPPLLPDPAGKAWLVTQVNGTAARAHMWKMLNNPATFKH